MQVRLHLVHLPALAQVVLVEEAASLVVEEAVGAVGAGNLRSLWQFVV